jgi:hypothetical protein
MISKNKKSSINVRKISSCYSSGSFFDKKDFKIEAPLTQEQKNQKKLAANI